MYQYTDADIKVKAESLPAKLTSLKGALKIHELQVDSSGKVSAKNLPTDPSYFAVNIRGSHNYLSMANRMDQPDIATFPDEE